MLHLTVRPSLDGQTGMALKKNRPVLATWTLDDQTAKDYLKEPTSHLIRLFEGTRIASYQLVREAVSYRGLFTAG